MSEMYVVIYSLLSNRIIYRVCQKWRNKYFYFLLFTNARYCFPPTPHDAFQIPRLCNEAHRGPKRWRDGLWHNACQLYADKFQLYMHVKASILAKIST